MLKITWSTGPNLPQGFQDSDGGILDDTLITVAGFCSGGLEEDDKRKPGRYPRGFLNKGWSLNLAAKNALWTPLPPFPGAPRQGLSSANVKNSLSFWGGFSYSAPYTYADGYKLSRRNDAWQWTPLPPLPWPATTAAMTVVNQNIYALGGADYNADAFFTETDRHGKTKRLGARLLTLDTDHLEKGWTELPPCPGTPRWVHAFAAVGKTLYLIGGASGNVVIDGQSYGYCTVVDNWSFNLDTQKWSRLRDLPVSSGNFPKSSQLVYNNRYLILPGGHQYAHVLNPDGSIRDKYGQASSANPKSGLHNDVFVYDTKTNRFGAADPLPIDNNLPTTVVRGNKIYLMGGETGGGFIQNEYYGHHPDLLLIGTISKPATR
jgi:N-acetylneuraminic acid mutarotase